MDGNNISTRLYAVNVAELKNEALYNKAYMMVTDERRKKTDAIRMPKNKYLSLGAELLLMYGLKQQGVDLCDIRYGYGINGKPYISGEDNIHFNISHSGEVAVCVLSSKEIGCDIEKSVDNGSKFSRLKIAERFFAAEECEMIAAMQSEELKREMFFRLWTLKESFIKATGAGMSIPLNSFCIHIDGDGIFAEQEIDDNKYFFCELKLWQEYKCSMCGMDSRIAVKGGVECKKLSLSELMV